MQVNPKIPQKSRTLTLFAAMAWFAALLILAPFPLSAQTITQSTLYTFTGGTDGADPGPLIQGSDGNYYGTAVFGGNGLTSGACDQGTGCGTVFRITPSGSFTVLYTFTGGSDGAYPNPLIEGGDGNFYGTATFGGYCVYLRHKKATEGCGTIFRITPAGDFTVLYTFTDGADDAFPNSLIQGSDGNFYGTTVGSVFQMTPSGTLTTLHNFTGSSDGSFPLGLVQGSDGIFYGATQFGGYFGNYICEYGCGVVFSITSSGSLTPIYTFTGGSDSGESRSKPNPLIVIKQPGHQIHQCPPSHPHCSRTPTSLYTNALVEGSDGTFYGATPGLNNEVGEINGTVFDITLSGNLTTLHTFNGFGSLNSLVLDNSGNLYGTGGAGAGAVFQLTPSANFINLYDFTGGTDGAGPSALLLGSDDSLYGATAAGGNLADCGGNGCGTLFRLSPPVGSPPSAPVQLFLSSSEIKLGTPVKLYWNVANAFSTTLQQCYAFVQGGATGGGNWTGIQNGTLTSVGYSGSATLTPTTPGTYTYALTCGGQESGFATLSVN
ncbi:MAG: choice-of-anchor tandem repeat GloVer-containing protein [Terriglobales bacterium]|jgi:uncharacterized repeat protein (TIGR03803 family)